MGGGASGGYGRTIAGVADLDPLNIKNNQSPLDLPKYKYMYRYMYRDVYCLTFSHAVAQKRGGGYKLSSPRSLSVLRVL